MNKRQLLFVTYQDEHIDEGISYAIQLARAMLEDIVVLAGSEEGHVEDAVRYLDGRGGLCRSGRARDRPRDHLGSRETSTGNAEQQDHRNGGRQPR